MARTSTGGAPPTPLKREGGLAGGRLTRGGSLIKKSDCGACTCDILMAQHRSILNYRSGERTLGVRRASFDRSRRTRETNDFPRGGYPSRGGDGVIVGWVQPTGLAVFPAGCTHPTNLNMTREPRKRTLLTFP